eukprot:scaffold14903_cov107-Isochrysis_galbana.AAC.4
MLLHELQPVEERPRIARAPYRDRPAQREFWRREVEVRVEGEDGPAGEEVPAHPGVGIHEVGGGLVEQRLNKQLCTRLQPERHRAEQLRDILGVLDRLDGDRRVEWRRPQRRHLRLCRLHEHRIILHQHRQVLEPSLLGLLDSGSALRWPATASPSRSRAQGHAMRRAGLQSPKDPGSAEWCRSLRQQASRRQAGTRRLSISGAGPDG